MSNAYSWIVISQILISQKYPFHSVNSEVAIWVWRRCDLRVCKISSSKIQKCSAYNLISVINSFSNFLSRIVYWILHHFMPWKSQKLSSKIAVCRKWTLLVPIWVGGYSRIVIWRKRYSIVPIFKMQISLLLTDILSILKKILWRKLVFPSREYLDFSRNTMLSLNNFPKNMPKNTSEHILNTSANLLGFCLVIITSLHFTNNAANSLIDECSALAAILLAFSCFFSFGAIRSNNTKQSIYFETIADYLFITSLFGVLITTVLIALSII